MIVTPIAARSLVAYHNKAPITTSAQACEESNRTINLHKYTYRSGVGSSESMIAILINAARVQCTSSDNNLNKIPKYMKMRHLVFFLLSCRFIWAKKQCLQNRSSSLHNACMKLSSFLSTEWRTGVLNFRSVPSISFIWILFGMKPWSH